MFGNIRLSIALVLGLLAVGSVISAHAQEPKTYSLSLTSEATYRAASPEAREVQRWLMEHATFHKGVMIGEPDKLGDVRVVYQAKASSGFQPTAPGDGPPVPLPPGGNLGDTITITSSSGGWTQTWSYVWVGNTAGGNWSLIEYRFFRNRPA